VQWAGRGGSEVEPFKTSIVLKFAREWPFVVYALTLLAAGRFVERFFCRYLCPLGAALAIPILDAAQYTPPSPVYSFRTCKRGGYHDGLSQSGAANGQQSAADVVRFTTANKKALSCSARNG